MMEMLTSGFFWFGFLGVVLQIVAGSVEWRNAGLLPDTFESLLKYLASHQITIFMSLLCYIGVESFKMAMGAQFDAYCFADGYLSQTLFNQMVMKKKDWHNTNQTQENQ